MSAVVKPHFTVEEEIVPEKTSADHQAAVKMLMLGLSALAQRTVHALADMFTLLTVGSVFWLFTATPDPNVMQLVQLGGYCVFVLMVNWIVRRKGP